MRGRFSETVTRYYFSQILDALEYMHNKGFAHRDLKPANILLSNNFSLKITDFGLTTGDAKGFVNEFCGTKMFMAPEIWLNNYQPQVGDIFAAGVILFYMFAGEYPFRYAAHEKDDLYRHIVRENHEDFWAAHQHLGVRFPNEFKDLMGRMLHYNPTKRLTL